MIHNVELVMAKTFDKTPIFRLWPKINNSPFLPRMLNEYNKLVENIIVQVLGFVENERTFNNMTYMKNKLQNLLKTYFDSASLAKKNLTSLLSHMKMLFSIIKILR
jgi:hypothetical protein